MFVRVVAKGHRLHRERAHQYEDYKRKKIKPGAMMSRKISRLKKGGANRLEHSLVSREDETKPRNNCPELKRRLTPGRGRRGGV